MSKDLQHRRHRLRLHGPRPLERLLAGEPFLPARAQAGAQGVLWPGRRRRTSSRSSPRPGATSRWSSTGRRLIARPRHRPDRRLRAQHTAPRRGDRRGQGGQDDRLREAAGDERRARPRRWSPRSRRPAWPTWSRSTTAACRPSRWPSRSSTKAASAGRSTTGPPTTRTTRSRPTCRRAAWPCGGSTPRWPAPA